MMLMTIEPYAAARPARAHREVAGSSSVLGILWRCVGKAYFSAEVAVDDRSSNRMGSQTTKRTVKSGLITTKVSPVTVYAKHIL